MQEELVSVVIPTYNRGDTILRCLDTVLLQTYKNIEVIVVDDGSTDETCKLFENYPDTRVRYVTYSDNRGACYARNYGAAMANGEYIAFQDSDDEWVPDKIEKQIIFLKKTNADFVFCGMNRINPFTKEKYYYPETAFEPNKDVLEQLLANNVISTQTILIKRNLFANIKFDTTFMRYQDWDFSLQAAVFGANINYLKEALVNSTVQSNSISATVKEGNSYEHLFEKYQEEYKKYPNSLASMYSKMAHGFKQIDRSKAIRYFQSSLKYKFDFKLGIKYILYCMHLWN